MKEIITKLKSALASADCILIGAGAGLSAAAGYDYAGARFLKYFSDFHTRFGIEDIYSGGFYQFPSREMFWAWWSRSIWINRYAPMPASDVYPNLLHLVEGRDYFVLTTNVDHAFQRANLYHDTRRCCCTKLENFVQQHLLLCNSKHETYGCLVPFLFPSSI